MHLTQQEREIAELLQGGIMERANMPSFYSSPLAEEVDGIVNAERSAFATKEMGALWNPLESLERTMEELRSSYRVAKTLSDKAKLFIAYTRRTIQEERKMPGTREERAIKLLTYFGARWVKISGDEQRQLEKEIERLLKGKSDEDDQLLEVVE